MNVLDHVVGDPGFVPNAQPVLRLLLDHRDVVCHRPEPTVPPLDDDDDEDEDDDDRGSSGGNIDPDDDEGDFDDDDDDEDETLWTAVARRALTGHGYC